MRVWQTPVLVAAALAAATACALPTRPSGAAELDIRGTTLLTPGARGQLVALLPSNGQLRDVRARWAGDGDAISLSTDGRVTGVRLGRATVRAEYQGLTGSTTVHVVGDVAGTWRGSIAVLDCWQTTATVPDP